MRLPALLLLLLLAAAPAGAQPAADAAAAGGTADVEALIRILEDDASRRHLVDRLRAVVDESGSAPASAEQTLIHQVAEYARRAVEGSADLIGTVIELGARFGAVLSGAATADIQELWEAVRGVILVIAVTFCAYFLLRLAFRRVQRVFAEAARRSGIARRAGIIALSATADGLTVLAAWMAGAVPALLLGWSGQTGIGRTLFLDAFLSIELAKVAARVLLAPRWPALRFSRIDDTTAAYWYFWGSRLVSILGYAFLFVAPILAVTVSGGAAEALRVGVLFCVLAMACVIVLQNRDAVRSWLLRHAERGGSEPLVRVLAVLARFWHVVTICYLILIFVLWLSDRQAALPFVLLATAQSILAAAIGVLLTIAFTRLAAGGMHLPADIRKRLPLLERRLNAFVPTVLRVIGAIVMVTVALAMAQIWRVADFIGWVSSEYGQRMVTSVISAALVLFAGGLAYLAVQSWVEYRLDPEQGRVPTPRERTLLALFRNAFQILLGVVVTLLVLAELGVNIGPLLAGAGIVGLAVGFGSQKLVQDIINGAFIQFENAMNEGDVVTVGGVTGIVERLTIRSVSLRSLDGAYHLIPFSSVDSVSNFMRSFSYHVVAIGVDYGEDIPQVKQAVAEAFERLRRSEHGEHIIGDFEMQGVTEFGDSAIVVRARIKTAPGQQWVLGRAYNEILKEVFDRRGIEIPFPHVTLHTGKEKPGREGSKAPRARAPKERPKTSARTPAANKRPPSRRRDRKAG